MPHKKGMMSYKGTQDKYMKEMKKEMHSEKKRKASKKKK